MTVRFEREILIDAPPELVFDLSLDIDAHRSSRPASNERAIAGVTTGRIGLGETVTWRATHFRIPFRMTSKVTALERPRRFVDEQVRGPFRSFHHEHLFGAVGAGSRSAVSPRAAAAAARIETKGIGWSRDLREQKRG